MVLHPKQKSEDGLRQMQEALAAAKESAGPEGKLVLGIPKKEEPDGPIMEKWAQAYAEDGSIEVVDVSGALGDVFAVKEASEITNIRKASFLGAKALKVQ